MEGAAVAPAPSSRRRVEKNKDDAEGEYGTGIELVDNEDEGTWVRLDGLPRYLQREVRVLFDVRKVESFRTVWKGETKTKLTANRDHQPRSASHEAAGEARTSSQPSQEATNTELVISDPWPDRNSDIKASPPLPDYAELEIRLLAIQQIVGLGPKSREQAWAQLLLLRHELTLQIGEAGLRPALVSKRARCYEHLGFDELAVGDAYVAFTLASGESEDLVDRTLDSNGGEWDIDGKEALQVRIGCLRIMVRALHRLGAASEVNTWEDLLKAETDQFEDFEDWRLFEDDKADAKQEALEGVYGRCQRVVYPWNEHEPDRMSPESISEINQRLKEASDGMLECKKTVLPSLLSPSDTHPQPVSDRAASPPENAQLGLFATTSLPASTSVLHERSPLAAIRPHDAPLCDCCASDLEAIDPSLRRCCPACSTPFCSQECLRLAGTTYHNPNYENQTTEQGYPPLTTPFCPDQSSEISFANLGRAESSSTPEWDLYILLIVRCIQMAVTLDVHPLDLFEVKHLWGAMTPTPSLSAPSPFPSTSSPRTLPFSLNHHVILPFQLFEYLLLSLPHLYPFSPAWLDRFDFWTFNSLYAKFRGVATASQSSFDGRPEAAQVHPLWSLVNHSCAPNVDWEPGGVRGLRVREGMVVVEGEEIFNHYTDVGENDVRIRRGRLMEVLGGECMCVRCIREAEEMERKRKAR